MESSEARGAAPGPVAPYAGQRSDDAPVDPALEWKLRAVAIALAFAFRAWPTGHFLQRTFLGMRSTSSVMR